MNESEQQGENKQERENVSLKQTLKTLSIPTETLKMIRSILLMIIMLLLIKIITAIQVDDEVNKLFCQLNEYAVMRVNDGENVFPCDD